jgi:hypothetical protein
MRFSRSLFFFFFFFGAHLNGSLTESGSYACENKGGKIVGKPAEHGAQSRREQAAADHPNAVDHYGIGNPTKEKDCDGKDKRKGIPDEYV